MNVDDLPVDQVLLQEKVAAVVSQRRGRCIRAELECSGGGFHHVLRRDEAEAVAGLQHEPGDSAGIGARGYSYVFELAAQVALCVRNRSAEQSCETHANCRPRLHRLSVDLFKLVEGRLRLTQRHLDLKLPAGCWGRSGAGEPTSAEAKDSPVTGPTQGRRSLRLSSTMESVSEVEAAADRLAIEAGLNDDERFHVTMAVHEAAINAVLHGNDYDPALHVDVSMENTGSALIFVIADQGKGFDPDKLPDPSASSLFAL
jgi:isopentenyldiphosphate isomerase